MNINVVLECNIYTDLITGVGPICINLLTFSFKYCYILLYVIQGMNYRVCTMHVDVPEIKGCKCHIRLYMMCTYLETRLKDVKACLKV